ncbi:hypothetical protein AX14_006835 [Amanita brunnescens Koide BX004]|nr:hypothetical protein AX14_006835 [Amanita brunnescens Koide BX004]
MASIVIPLAIQRVLRITKSDVGFANIFLPVIVRPSLVAGTLFWFAEWADSTHVLAKSAGSNEDFWAPMLRGIRSWLARFAFGWPLLAGFGIWWFIPLCIQIQVNDDSQMDPFATGPKGEAQLKSGLGPKRQVTVLGFANAFGSPYLLFWIVFFCVVYVSVQLTAQFVLGLATVALLAYLEIMDSVRDARSIDVAFNTGTPSSIMYASPTTSSPAPTSPETGAAVRAATQLRFSDVVPISLLGQLAFYATGHQATVSSIQWKAAFLLTETVKYPWSPFTVAFNFLGPVAVFAGLGVPLAAMWNRAPSMSSEDSRSREKETKQSVLVPVRERYDAEVKADSTLAALGVMIYFGMLLLGTAMSAAILRRHLMVWKVFAPRFMAAADCGEDWAGAWEGSEGVMDVGGMNRTL